MFMFSGEDRGRGGGFSIRIFGGRTWNSSWLQYSLVVVGGGCGRGLCM